MGLTKYFQLFQLISSKGLVFFLGDDAGFEANTYKDFSIKTKGQSSDKLSPITLSYFPFLLLI